MIRKIRVAFVALICSLALLGGALTASPKAVAAGYPHCNSTKTMYRYAGGKTWKYILPSNSGSLNCVLYVGASGATPKAIKALQWDIRKLYGDLLKIPGTKIAIDGAYGGNTKAAVKVIQKRYSLDPDGKYGPKTKSGMLWMSRNTHGGVHGYASF